MDGQYKFILLFQHKFLLKIALFSQYALNERNELWLYTTLLKIFYSWEKILFQIQSRSLKEIFNVSWGPSSGDDSDHRLKKKKSEAQKLKEDPHVPTQMEWTHQIILWSFQYICFHEEYSSIFNF